MALRRVSYLALAACLLTGGALVACSSDDGGGSSDAGTGQETASGDDGGGGGQDSGAQDSGAGQDASDSGGGNVTFGNECQVPDQQSDCAAGLTCRDYPKQGKHLCTKACSGDGDCPAPSNKCGGQGFCAFP